MTRHSPFHWPDEDPGRLPPASRLRGWLGLRPAVPRPILRRTQPWRLRELWRTRPVPLAAALVVGMGPLAWALQQGPWDRRAQERALAEAPEPQWGEPLATARDAAAPLTAAAMPTAAEVAPASSSIGLAGEALGPSAVPNAVPTGAPNAAWIGTAGSATARTAVASTRSTAPSAAAGTTTSASATASVPSSATASPQWGDPLPGAAAAAAHAAAVVRASRPPRTTETRTVLASQYFGPSPEPGAEATVLAQAPLRSGMRMRLDTPWQATRELLEAVNPFIRVPRAAPVPPTPAVSAGGRALRLAELPDVIGLPLVLPVSDDPRVADAVSEGLTLQQAIDLTLGRSLEVKAARERLNAARHTVRAATGSLLPQIDGRAGVGRGDSEVVGTSTTERLARREGALTLRQPIVDVAARREVERQKALATTAELLYQASVGHASQDAAEAYLQALKARITLAMTERHERQLNRLLAQVEARSPGPGADPDRSRVQGRVAQVRAQRLEAAAVLQGSLRRLSLLIGQTPQAFELGRAPGIAIPADVASARQDATRLNRELLAGRAEAVAIAYEGLAHRARLLPRLDLEFSHARATNAVGAQGTTRDTRGMLVVNWQLYNGGSDLAQQRAAQARERERGLRADDLLQRLDHELEAAYAALDAVAPRFAAQREELLANAAAVSAFETQPARGSRTLLDVLDAYQRLHANRLELAGLVVHEVQRTLQVAQLTGRLAAAEPAEPASKP